MKLSDLTISFDIDETLIYADSENLFCRPPDFTVQDGFSTVYNVWVRPHAYYLLKVCFAACRGVGFFTNASRGFAQEVVKKLIQDIPNAKPLFLLCHENCTRVYLQEGMYSHEREYPRKKLSKVFSRTQYQKQGISRDNILHIDDKYTFEDNFGNGILVSSWKNPDRQQGDNTLYLLFQYLKEVICQVDVVSVRGIEKRGWMRNIR